MSMIEPVPPRAAAAAIAVVRGGRTMREVAAAMGVTPDTAMHALRVARSFGLVSFEDGKSGTLIPGVAVTAASPRRSALPSG